MVRTREVTKVEGNEFCTMLVELRPESMGWGENEQEGPPMACLAITAVTGYIVTERQARKEALNYWISYFEEHEDNIRSLNANQGTRFRSATSAARYVLSVDGEYHGLDIHKHEDGKVYIGTGWGCQHEEIATWFPDAIPHIPYHLNTYSNFFGPRRALPEATEAWALGKTCVKHEDCRKHPELGMACKQAA